MAECSLITDASAGVEGGCQPAVRTELTLRVISLILAPQSSCQRRKYAFCAGSLHRWRTAARVTVARFPQLSPAGQCRLLAPCSQAPRRKCTQGNDTRQFDTPTGNSTHQERGCGVRGSAGAQRLHGRHAALKMARQEHAASLPGACLGSVWRHAVCERFWLAWKCAQAVNAAGARFKRGRLRSTRAFTTASVRSHLRREAKA